MKEWSIKSWRDYPIKQAPNYLDSKELQEVQDQLRSFPPLVFAKEVDLLKLKLSQATQGNAFVLQGGDCAESFERFSGNNIRDLYKLILQMSVVLGFSSGMEIVKIGRIAGQFAKPRSQEMEVQNGIALPSYKGDILNALHFDSQARMHDPKRMLQAYHQSTATLNLLRAFCKGGLADLHLIQRYNLDFVSDHQMGEKYLALAKEISQALKFVESCGIDTTQAPNFSECFTSHEALLLHYEEPLCRQDSLTQKIYNCSAHFLWIGERTLDSQAHLEFMRGIENPKGLKIGTRISPSTLLKTLDLLNPQNKQGEITLIVRMGEEQIKHALPPLLQALKREGREVLWLNDPMHANTRYENGVKTRYFSSVLNEIFQFFQICFSEGVRAGGLHLEMTGENVTECLGAGITQEILGKNYTTQCDPRLNATQALELAFLVAQMLQDLKMRS